MTSEKKLRQELDETRNELKKVQNYAKTLRKKCSEDDVSLLTNIRLFNLLIILFHRIKINCDHFKKQFVILKKI
jgi:hypothetical protein